MMFRSLKDKFSRLIILYKKLWDVFSEKNLSIQTAQFSQAVFVILLINANVVWLLDKVTDLDTTLERSI